jgi:hypothetical protein
MRLDRSGQSVQIGRYSGSPTTLALGVASARVALNPSTHYRLWASVDCFFKFGDNTVVAATTDHPLTAKIDTLHRTDDTNTNIAGIVAAGTGILVISEINPYDT